MLQGTAVTAASLCFRKQPLRLRYGCHCEELHPLTVQAGKAMQCNDVAIFLLLLHRCQVRTCGVVIPKVDRHEMAMRASIYCAANIVAISRDDISILFHYRHYASGNSRNGCHCEELHPLTVQAGKAMQCNDVAIFLLLLHRCQVRTCGVVIPKVDRHEMAMRASIYCAANIVAISRDDISILLSFPRVSQLILNSEFVSAG